MLWRQKRTGGIRIAVDKPRRVLWPLTSPGCFGGVKVCLRMAEAMHEAGWEVSVSSARPWAAGAWANWDFAKRLSPKLLEPPYDMVVANHHETLPFGKTVAAKQYVALIQSDEPEWKTQGAGSQVDANFRLPGFKHVIIANHMRCFAEKYGHNIVGQLDNGVDSLTFYPTQFLKREWPHSLMMIRKNAPVWYTGQEYAEAAVLELAKRYDDLEVVVVGQSPPRWPCKVRHVQTFDQGELRGLFNSVSCFVRPSLIEGFSLTDLEAMSCGTPLVVTPRGLPDVARHGEEALFAPAEMSEDEFVRRAFDERMRPELGQEITAGIVEGVTRIFEKPPLREKLARNGLRLAQARTWERQRAQWMAVVEQVMAGE
jgi:glycosyltransferase involved in cell wall biosynthesis